ncbi:hypothetical protein ACOQFB_01130 [Anaeromyxobacter sp. Red801]|uniref:hypothetical protein n=1 Tax=Anaeromyxobacter sp. Red801 TaxID=3411632 RepID=UPI003B9DE516
MKTPRTHPSFAVFPYISVDRDEVVDLDPFVLWPNTPRHWVSIFGHDHTKFLQMYVDERGRPVGERASLLSRRDKSAAPLGDFRDAVVALSSAAWLRGEPGADRWLFEAWSAPRDPAATGFDYTFVRTSKFTRALTDPETERIFPTPYLRPLRFLKHQMEEFLNYVVPELSKPSGESIMTALGYFHRARFETPYFSSDEDDIEALWSGFESLFAFPRTTTKTVSQDWATTIRWARARRRAHGLDVHTRREILYQLARPPRFAKTLVIPRNEHLVACLKSELGADAFPPEFWAGVTAWACRAYEIRSAHAHGARVPEAQLRLDEYKRGVYAIGLTLARSILRLRAWSHQPALAMLEAMERDELISLFSEAPAVVGATRLLRKHDAKDWAPGAANDECRARAAALEKHLKDLIALPHVTERYRHDIRVRDACKKMALTLSRWSDSLSKNPPPGADVGAIAMLPGLISSLLKAQTSEEKLYKGMSEILVRNHAHTRDRYRLPDGPPSDSLVANGTIPIWTWVSGFIRLSELLVGYELR